MHGYWYEEPAGSISYSVNTIQRMPIFGGDLSAGVPGFSGYDAQNHTVTILNLPGLRYWNPQSPYRNFDEMWDKEMEGVPKTQEALTRFKGRCVRTVFVLQGLSTASFRAEEYEALVLMNKNNHVSNSDFAFLVPRDKTYVGKSRPSPWEIINA